VDAYPGGGGVSGRTLSVLIDAADGASGLAECLASVGFASERIVLVENLESEAAALAESLGARVARRGDDVGAAAGPWVLYLASDMRVPRQLADEILAAIAMSAAPVYAIRVRNLVGGRWIRHGWTTALAPSLRPLLHRRGAARAAVADLRTPVDRHVGQDISELLRRLDRETTRVAEGLARTGAAGTLAQARWAFCARFLSSYFGRAGFREGRMGLVLAVCAGLAPVLAHAKATLERKA
jgi:hypothetical protein